MRVSNPSPGLPIPVGSAGGCATLERGAGFPGAWVVATAAAREGHGLVLAPPGGGAKGAGAGPQESPPPPASAIGGVRGAGAGAAIGASVSRHGGAGGRRRSAALGTDLLTHISQRGHGARGLGAPPAS